MDIEYDQAGESNNTEESAYSNTIKQENTWKKMKKSDFFYEYFFYQSSKFQKI
jgi:hypothetical protein